MQLFNKAFHWNDSILPKFPSDFPVIFGMQMASPIVQNPWFPWFKILFGLWICLGIQSMQRWQCLLHGVSDLQISRCWFWANGLGSKMMYPSADNYETKRPQDTYKSCRGFCNMLHSLQLTTYANLKLQCDFTHSCSISPCSQYSDTRPLSCLWPVTSFDKPFQGVTGALNESSWHRIDFQKMDQWSPTMDLMMAACGASQLAQLFNGCDRRGLRLPVARWWSRMRNFFPHKV